MKALGRIVCAFRGHADILTAGHVPSRNTAGRKWAATRCTCTRCGREVTFLGAQVVKRKRKGGQPDPIAKRLARFAATIVYRTDKGPVDITHDIEEIEELGDLVERGPHWDTIERIVIVRVGEHVDRSLTVEQAAKL